MDRGWTSTIWSVGAERSVPGQQNYNDRQVTLQKHYISSIDTPCFQFEGGYSGYDFGYDQSHDTILSFDVINQVWTEVGHMNIKRFAHAISVVKAEDVVNYCSLQ